MLPELEEVFPELDVEEGGAEVDQRRLSTAAVMAMARGDANAGPWVTDEGNR